MADRIGIISNGRIILVEGKTALMNKLGKSQLVLQLQRRLDAIPASLEAWQVALAPDGIELVYTYDAQAETNGITALLRQLDLLGVEVANLQTRQSSLEDIFVSLVHTEQ
jgi:ABC-2 type transport system ATP-binding protein